MATISIVHRKSFISCAILSSFVPLTRDFTWISGQFSETSLLFSHPFPLYLFNGITRSISVVPLCLSLRIDEIHPHSILPFSYGTPLSDTPSLSSLFTQCSVSETATSTVGNTRSFYFLPYHPLSPLTFFSQIIRHGERAPINEFTSESSSKFFPRGLGEISDVSIIPSLPLSDRT